MITFTASTDATPEEGSITFKLPDVTSYEGRYMNDSGAAAHTGPDLYFAASQETLAGIEWSQGGPGTTEIVASWTTRPAKIVVPVNIVCNDFAAYGVIHAILKNPGYEKKEADPPRKIPEDDQPVYRMLGITMRGNKIADAWDAGKTDPLTGNPAILLPWRDRDYGGAVQNPHETTGSYYMHGRNNGDGFSVLEEYRGFVIGGGYMRLDPFVKEVFIGSFLSFSGNLNIRYGHVGLYGSSIPGMAVYQITDLKTEWKKVPGGAYGAHYLVNYTRGGVVGNPQYGIPIIDGFTDGARGVAYPGHRAALNHGQECVIDLDLIDDEEIPRRQLDATIAHEIGHAVGLDHHNERTMMRDPTKPESAHKGPPPDKKWLLWYPDDPSKDSCVMGGGNMDVSVWRTYMYGYRNFHSPVPAGLVPNLGANPKWEDHWHRYWLHDNHSHHQGYSP